MPNSEKVDAQDDCPQRHAEGFLLKAMFALETVIFLKKLVLTTVTSSCAKSKIMAQAPKPHDLAFLVLPFGCASLPGAEHRAPASPLRDFASDLDRDFSLPVAFLPRAELLLTATSISGKPTA